MENEQNTHLRIAGGQLLEARRHALGVQAPHSLELVGEVDGVAYINDSRATFLDAALASLAQMERRTIWITGAWGDDMGEGHVRELVQERVSAVVLFGPHVDTEVPGDVQLLHAGDLRTAVFVARELALDGEVVLFSPACPSGNGFANYEERGAEFKRAVRDL